jgi:hypothetical protein
VIVLAAIVVPAAVVVLAAVIVPAVVIVFAFVAVSRTSIPKLLDDKSGSHHLHARIGGI